MQRRLQRGIDQSKTLAEENWLLKLDWRREKENSGKVSGAGIPTV